MHFVVGTNDRRGTGNFTDDLEEFKFRQQGTYHQHSEMHITFAKFF